MKKVLVTGATGFVGRFIADELLRAGYDVRCSIRNLKTAAHLLDRKVEIVTADLCDESAAVEAARGVEAIIHAAGQLGGWGKKSLFVQSNTMTTRNLLRAASRLNIKRFIYVSSAASYGRQPDCLLNEDSPNRDESDPYCQTKLESEGLVREYSQQFGIKATVIRPSIVFGPFDGHFLPIVVQNVRRKRIFLVGKPGQGPPLVFVKDVAAFVSAVLGSQTTQFEIYNLSNPEAISWETIIGEVARSINVIPKIERIPFAIAYAAGAVLELLWKLARANKPPMITRFTAGLIGLQYHFDCSKALAIQGFGGFSPFSRSFRETVRWYRSLSQG